MSIKAITKYQTADGKEFETQPAALAHDAFYKGLVSVRKALQLANPGATIGTLDGDVARSAKAAKELRDACNKVLTYHRNHGTLRSQKTI